jgi:cytoskeleton protein RodZ
MNETRDDAPAAGAGPGKRLYEARMRAEGDEFDRLPGPTYVRGYLRNYAQLLGLPSDEIVQSYARSNGTLRTTRRNALTPEPEVTTRDATVRLATFLVAGLLILLAVVWWQGRSFKPTSSQPTTQVQQEAPPTFESGTAVITEPDTTVTTESTDDVVPRGDNGMDVAPVAAAEEPPAQAANVATTEPAAQNTTEALPAEATMAESVPAQADTAELVLRTRDTSWADIRDARGNKLLYMLVPGGSRMTVTGVPPFEVFVGNPEAVTVEFNGKHVEAVKFKRGLVARFTLDKPVPAAN